MNRNNTVRLEILTHNDNLFERFENAFLTTAKTYIECTPVDVSNINFKKTKSHIIVLYDYNSLELEYAFECEEGSVQLKASLPNGEIVDSYMEFWIKWVVEGFFADELEVESQHTNITFSNRYVMKTI
ncbi:hypothetical protein ACM26V_06860 [Salipaludibacillus sp. HK11]|uniref:hypothetical protein n=1 Tax=Salipaludibacillus sp. HK11 TaxID=3394320 RepID=UPI0039FDCF6C